MPAEERPNINSLLQRLHPDDLASRKPRDHSQRTPYCAPIGQFRDFARQGWPAGPLAEHAPDCPFCQKSICATWNATACPGWRLAMHPGFAIAFERHRQTCVACEAKFRILAAPASLFARIGEWTAIPWRLAPGGLQIQAADGSRPPIRIARLIPSANLELQLHEQGEALEIEARTAEPGMQTALVDLRIAGPRFDNTIRFRLANGHGSATLPLPPERLSDLASGVVLAVRIGSDA